MGCQAARGELRRRRPRPRLRPEDARDDQPHSGAGVPRGDQTVRRDGQPGALVCARRRRRGRARMAQAGDRQAGEALRRGHRQDTLEGQPEGAREADRDRGRRAAHHQRSTRGRADRGPRLGRARGRLRGLPQKYDPLLPQDAAGRPAQVARALPLRARRSQGRRCRERRHPRLHHAPARPRRRRPALPAIQRGGSVGAGVVPRQERRSPTTVSASSRVSG